MADDVGVREAANGDVVHPFEFIGDGVKSRKIGQQVCLRRVAGDNHR